MGGKGRDEKMNVCTTISSCSTFFSSSDTCIDIESKKSQSTREEEEEEEEEQNCRPEGEEGAFYTSSPSPPQA